MATPTEISDLLTAMEEVCPRKEPLSDAATKIYVAVLGDLPIEILQMAVKDYLTTGTFFPVPAELRKRAISYSMAALPTPMEAWDEIQRRLVHKNKRRFICDKHAEMRSQATLGSEGYWEKLHQIEKHVAECSECRVEDVLFHFSHPIVEKMFEVMGGLKLMDSEYEIADRSQFVTSYNQLAEREIRSRVQLPEVKALAEKMSINQLPSGGE